MAATVEIARLLIERKADVNAVDHVTLFSSLSLPPLSFPLPLPLPLARFKVYAGQVHAFDGLHCRGQVC